MPRYLYDVFISYAIEDKHTVAAPLARYLYDAGLKVYFVGDELEAGHSISDTVFTGLEQSRFCVPVLSNDYVRKWPAIERSHILRRERKTGKPLVFPVWNNIAADDVARLFPELADHYAPSVDAGLEQAVLHLTRSIAKRKRHDVRTYQLKRVAAFCAVAVALFTVYLLSQNNHGSGPQMHNSSLVSPDH